MVELIPDLKINHDLDYKLRFSMVQSRFYQFFAEKRPRKNCGSPKLRFEEVSPIVSGKYSACITTADTLSSLSRSRPSSISCSGMSLMLLVLWASRTNSSS